MTDRVGVGALHIRSQSIFQILILFLSPFLPCPFMVKSFKDFHLENGILATWYTVFGSEVPPSMFTCDPWLTYDLFFEIPVCVYE